MPDGVYFGPPKTVSAAEYREILRKLPDPPVKLPPEAKPRPGRDVAVINFQGRRETADALWWTQKERDQLRTLWRATAEASRHQRRDAQKLSAEERTRLFLVALSNAVKKMQRDKVPDDQWRDPIMGELGKQGQRRKTWKHIAKVIEREHGIKLPRQRKRKLAPLISIPTS